MKKCDFALFELKTCSHPLHQASFFYGSKKRVPKRVQGVIQGCMCEGQRLGIALSSSFITKTSPLGPSLTQNLKTIQNHSTTKKTRLHLALLGQAFPALSTSPHWAARHHAPLLLQKLSFTMDLIKDPAKHHEDPKALTARGGKHGAFSALSNIKHFSVLVPLTAQLLGYKNCGFASCPTILTAMKQVI